MRSYEDAKNRWHITLRQPDLDSFKKSVRSDGKNNPCLSGLRSVCWKNFLLFQSPDITRWSAAISDSRSAYTSLRQHFLRYIENPDELGSAVDPLDDNKHSPWNSLRQDEEIRAEIFQDIERCMPEEPYFRRPETQHILLDILFIFCKINQDVGYRQGMHEVLAPILWVVEGDAIDISTSGGDKDDVTMDEVLDSTFIEHDSFTLLSLIMRSAKSFYELGEPDKKASTVEVPGTPQLSESPIVERSKKIHEVYLARVDPALARYLTEIEILPQIFLIRWIRVLFGREFPFDDLLALWDTLFAEDPGLELIDMVCVAMLLRIRWELLDSNYSFALMLLLKYPPPSTRNGPQTFVDDAIFLRDNFSSAGGSAIISKYSGRRPSTETSDSRPETPLGQGLSPKRQLSRTRSPLPSPARFLQQQGGIEGLFQGATKNLLDRSERLGINQAVRDAVGEAKKNMQGLQASRNNSASRRTPDVKRWSLDEGRQIPASRASVTAINVRNKQLARMLEQAMADLREVSLSPDADKETYVQAMDMAIAKVEFVKVYLEDATMPLPDVPNHTESPINTPKHLRRPALPSRLSEAVLTIPSPESQTSTEQPATQPIQGSSRPSQNITPVKPPSPSPKGLTINENTIPTLDLPASSIPEPSSAIPTRPKAPVPTRSTIAQSSFSWMLEPDTTSSNPSSSLHPAPPKSTSPFIKSNRKQTSGVRREKAAFLFGEEEEPSERLKGMGLVDVEEGEAIDLGTMKGKER